MKTKHKVSLLIISFLMALFSTVLIAIPQGASAQRGRPGNDVIRHGFSNKAEFKKKFNRAYYIFKHYGIKKTDIDGLKGGVVHKNGNIYVGSKKVATNARSTGRTALDCPNKVIRTKGDTFYERSTGCAFGSSKLKALVKLDKNGVFKYAVLYECANPVIGKSVKKTPKPKKPSVKIFKAVNKEVATWNAAKKYSELFTYSMHVKNNGETGLKNIKITDKAPAGVEFDKSETEKVNKNNKDIKVSVSKKKVTIKISGSLAKNGTSGTYKIKARFVKKAHVPVVNKVCVNATSTLGNAKPKNVSDCATANNRTGRVNVGIEKTVSKPVVLLGEQFSYTIAVKNKTSKDLNNVKIVDDARKPYVEFIPGSGGGVGAKITKDRYEHTIVKLKKGETRKLSFKAKFVQMVSNDVVNKACAKVSGEEFCAKAKNRPKVEMKITKSVDKPEVKIGEEFTYTVKVTNPMGVDIIDANVYDHIKSPYLELVPGSETGGWKIDTVLSTNSIAAKSSFLIKAGETQTFTVRAKYKEGTATGSIGNNQACTSSPTNKITDICADASNKVVSPTPPVLQITKATDKVQVKPGEVFVYTVKVKNIGQTDILAARLVDEQPVGVQFIEGTATNGASIQKGDPNKIGKEVVWFGKESFPLKAGEEQTFTVQAKMTNPTASEAINVACVSAVEVPAACANVKTNLVIPVVPPKPPAPKPAPQPIPQPTPPPAFQIAKTGPVAVAASVVGVSALGYGVRQWTASRRAIEEATKNLYKK